MELLSSLLLVLALAIMIALFVARPLIERAAEKSPGEPQTAAESQESLRSALLAERDRIINALQELEFDNTLGKIPAEDYPIQRTALLQSGADVLRRLDEMQPTSPPVDTAEERIAAAVAARRADAALVKAPELALNAAAGSGQARAHSDAVEDLIAARRRLRQEKSAGFCPQCGRPVKTSDRFCSHCGARL